MHSPVMDQQRDRSGGGDKDAHNRETLQTTGFYVGRIVIVTREFAPIPHTPARLPIPMAIRMRFLRHDGIFRSDVVQTKTKPWGGTEPPPDGRPRAQVKERAGRITPFSSSTMSSGRLFLDRVARQHGPSPLHRQVHPKTVPGSGTMNLQRTANSVLTVCLSQGDNRTTTHGSLAIPLTRFLTSSPSHSRESLKRNTWGQTLRSVTPMPDVACGPVGNSMALATPATPLPSSTTPISATTPISRFMTHRTMRYEFNEKRPYYVFVLCDVGSLHDE